MTLQQLYLFAAFYVLLLAVVAILTRATPRRIAGALAGTVPGGVLMLIIAAFGESAGWWHFVMNWTPFFLVVMCITMIPCGFVFLLTWRIARRFGGRGLAVSLFIVAVLGPVRDYSYMAAFPEWGAYGPGLAPVLGISAAYVTMGVVGHGLMRLIAGPAGADRLAQRG